MAAAIAAKYTPEEYLRLERAAAFKSEYWHGEVFAMAGTSDNHGLVAANLSRFAQNRLGNSACRLFAADMKVGVTKKRGFAYPDIVITCGDRQFYDDTRDVLLNPLVIFEVLSPSPRAFDLGDKFQEYQRLASLRHYVLVEQTRYCVMHYEWIGANRWNYEVLEGREAVLKLAAAGIELPLEEIYFRVDLPVEAPDSGA